MNQSLGHWSYTEAVMLFINSAQNRRFMIGSFKAVESTWPTPLALHTVGLKNASFAM